LDEYLNIAKDFYNSEFSSKIQNFYIFFDKEYKFKNDTITQPFINAKVSKDADLSHSNFFYTDDQIASLNLLATNDFFIFPLVNPQTLLEDSYESLKFLNFFYNSTQQVFYVNTTNFYNPISYSAVFDIFRSDYDEFS